LVFLFHLIVFLRLDFDFFIQCIYPQLQIHYLDQPESNAKLLYAALEILSGYLALVYIQRVFFSVYHSHLMHLIGNISCLFFFSDLKSSPEKTPSLFRKISQIQ